MILKLRSMAFPLKPESLLWIWLLLAASISPSTCAFDIILDQREFSSGPFNLNGDGAAKNWEPFSLNRRSESAEPRIHQPDTSKHLRHLAKASSNDVHIRANDYSPNMLAHVPTMDRLLRDLAKWKHTKQIVKELRRRNNIPTWNKSWKKKHARNADRSSLRKQDPSRSYRAAPTLDDPFRDTLYRSPDSGDEVLAGFVSTGQSSEPTGDAFILDSAVGFEDFAVTPIKQSPVLQGFGQFPDEIDASENSRNLRQEFGQFTDGIPASENSRNLRHEFGQFTDGIPASENSRNLRHEFGQFTDGIPASENSRILRQEEGFEEGGFEVDSTGCTDIATRRCDDDNDCKCNGFYTCINGQCSLLNGQVSDTNSNRNSQPEQWHEQPVVLD